MFTVRSLMSALSPLSCSLSAGRWVMFGWMVGFLTEYATGVDFPQQLLLMASYLGLADFD